MILFLVKPSTLIVPSEFYPDYRRLRGLSVCSLTHIKSPPIRFLHPQGCNAHLEPSPSCSQDKITIFALVFPAPLIALVFAVGFITHVSTRLFVTLVFTDN